MCRGAYFVWLPTSKMAKMTLSHTKKIVAQTTGLILGVDIRLGGGVLPLKYENPSSNYMASAQLCIKSPYFPIWAPLDEGAVFVIKDSSVYFI